MRRTREVSSTFEFDPQDCNRLIATLIRLGADRTGETKTLSLYLDTPDAAIGNLGLGFALRRDGAVTPADLKAALGKIARGAAAARGWTRFIEPLSAATPGEARRRLGSLLRRRDARARLATVFRIETQGSLWSATMGGASVEISLDRVHITAEDKKALRAVVAFTCRAEAAANLFRFLAEICAPAKLRMSAEESALCGYRLCGHLRASHITAFAPKLAAKMVVATAFRTIARAAFDQFLLNEAAIRLTRDPEAVHQCRVALRRLSAGLRLFSSVVSGPGREDLRSDLKQIAAHLQSARDLDVLIADVIEPAVADASAATEDLRHVINGRRKIAYDALVAALSTPQTAELYLRVVGWIEAGDWTIDPKRENRRHEPIAAFVERKLDRAVQKFKKRCDKLEESNEEERHRTRIRAKNLRYSAEFFETLVAPKTLRGKTVRKRFHAFIGALKELQTILGDANDVSMARRFFAALAQDIGESGTETTSKATLAAVDSIAGGLKDRSEAEFRKKAAKARRALAEVKPFWGAVADASRARTERR